MSGVLTEDGDHIEEVVENDPTEYIPIMRHHLHSVWLVINQAQGKQSAEDLAEAYRHGEYVWKQSKLTDQLSRSSELIAGYLGLRDDEEEKDEPVSENE